jgi:Tfp pilus assembly protein PilV
MRTDEVGGRRRGKSGSRRGISLTEVTVALGILGVAVTGTIRAIPVAYQTIFRAGDITTATALAQQRLEQLRNRPIGDAALAAGTTEEANLATTAGFLRRTIVADLAGEGLKQITVQIIPAGRGQTAPTVELTTLRGF